jgi:hypothetical protein
VLCSCRYFLGTRVRSARFGNAQAIPGCGEPVQLQLSKGFFAFNRAEGPIVGQSMGVLRIAR